MNGRHEELWHPEGADDEQIIYAARLTEGVAASTRRSRLTLAVAGFVGWVVKRVLRKQRLITDATAQERIFSGSIDASSLAASALAGKLEGSSLEGSLRRAQIAELYASAAQKNADAELTRAKAQATRQQAALEELNAIVELLIKFGATPKVTRMPDGTISIVLGESLLASLPPSATDETVKLVLPPAPRSAPRGEDRPGPQSRG